MDSGEEIPALNESWTFFGAKVSEWAAGIAFMIMATEVFQMNPGKFMPQLLIMILVVTLGLASIRRRFPDEERGLMYKVCDACGFPPPGIPTPASLQSYWSGSPIRSIKEKTYYDELGLDEVFFVPEEDDE